MINGHFLVGLAALFGFEIDSKVAVDNGRVSADVTNIPAGDRIDGVDQMVRLVQWMALPRSRGNGSSATQLRLSKLIACVCCVSVEILIITSLVSRQACLNARQLKLQGINVPAYASYDCFRMMPMHQLFHFGNLPGRNIDHQQDLSV